MLGRRGVAEVIATMLLIIITVAAALLLYGYASGLMGRLQGAAMSQPYLEQVSLDYYNWPATGYCSSSGTKPILCLTLRNVGVATVTVSNVFVNGVLQTATLSNVGSGTGCNSPTGNVPLNTACMETIASFASNTFSGSATPTSGVAYEVKVVTQGGAIFSYSCIAGEAA